MCREYLKLIGSRSENRDGGLVKEYPNVPRTSIEPRDVLTPWRSKAELRRWSQPDFTLQHIKYHHKRKQLKQIVIADRQQAN